MNDHAHSHRGFSRSAEGACGGFCVVFVCMWGGVIAAHAVLCFKAAPLSGESVVLPITVTPKDAQLREGERDVYWKVVSCW